MEYVSLRPHLVQLLKTYSQYSFRACSLVVHVVKAKYEFRATRTAFQCECEGDIVTDSIVFLIKGIVCIDRNCPEGRSLCREFIIQLVGSPQ